MSRKLPVVMVPRVSICKNSGTADEGSLTLYVNLDSRMEKLLPVGWEKNLIKETRFHFKMLNCALLIDEWSP